VDGWLIERGIAPVDTFERGSPSELPRSAEVVVVGGGAAGVCAAYELAQRGREVLLLERGTLCSGSSYGNAAFIAPSRSLPLGAPGVILKSLRWMLEPHGVFRLRPRPDPELVRWLWAFRRSCREAAAHHSALVVRDLTRESLEMYEAYAAAFDFGFHRAGLLELFRTPDGQAAAEVESRRLSEIDVITSLLAVGEVRERLPMVSPSVTGALYCAEDAHIDPPVFVHRLAVEAQKLGVIISTGTEMLRVEPERGRIRMLHTNRGAIEADTVVLANGAWAARIGHRLGLRLLIEPAKGYAFQVDGFGGERPSLPLIFNEARITVTPLKDGVRITSKLDLVGFNTAMRGSRISAIPEAATDYVSLPAKRQITERWTGFRPLTPDGLPLVGHAPGISNLILAVGGGRMGLALAPVMGRLVGRIHDRRNDHPHLDDLAVDRFGPA
jgi:D-amino-acid dehydrogenase